MTAVLEDAWHAANGDSLAVHHMRIGAFLEGKAGDDSLEVGCASG